MNVVRPRFSVFVSVRKLFAVRHFSVGDGRYFSYFPFSKHVKDVIRTMPSRNQKVVLSAATFPRAQKVLEETVQQYVLFSGTFDGSTASFQRVVNDVKTCHELNTYGIRDIVVMTLQTIASSPIDYDLSNVQAVVIQRLGDHVVVIHNSSVSGGKDRRVLFLALNDLRLALAAESTIEEISRIIVNHSPRINWPAYGLAALGLISIGIGHVTELVKALHG